MTQRRDPRAERQARLISASGTPRFVLAASPAPQTSPSRPRRNPRTARRAATVVSGIRPRIDWHSARIGLVADIARRQLADSAQQAPEICVIPDPAFLVLAVPDLPGGALSDHDRQLIGAARQFADAGGGVVVVLTTGDVAGLDNAGADRVMPLPGALSADDPEGRATAVLAVIDMLKPRHVLFPESAEGGADLARRVAALLSTFAKSGFPVFAKNDAPTGTLSRPLVGFPMEACFGERLFSGIEVIEPYRVARRTLGGTMEMAGAPPRLMSIAENAAAEHSGARHEARQLEPPDLPPLSRRIETASPLAVEADHLPLTDADFILSGGNGVTDWTAFAELGRVLGATPGGSRVVCDEGHLPRDRQVGASGSLVTARCYLAFGIAGAPQHLQGITGVRHVVAVNTDLHAEMIKRADLAIIADAQAVMPALIRHARERHND